ncbi:hypothetical protein E0G79_09670 [Salmonella enterica]|nr:hypothetical protein [Salmonella enterica]
MSDRRLKLRTGKSQFVKFDLLIRQRRREGYTNRQIYFDLVDKGLQISETQFNRYIRRFYGEGTSQGENVVAEDKRHSGSKTTDSAPYGWYNMAVTNKRLIRDLEAYGLTPDDVRQWGLPNEMAIRQRLTMMQVNDSRSKS